jgi:hypothetical protein
VVLAKPLRLPFRGIAYTKAEVHCSASTLGRKLFVVLAAKLEGPLNLTRTFLCYSTTSTVFGS